MMPESSVTVLVLDDEESIRQSIAAYLEDEGVTVLQASSAEEALGIVAASPVAAAVVDIRLPGMDGNAFMVKAAAVRPGIRFVVHTGSADYILPESVMALGVRPDRVFIKPVHDLKILMEALDLP
jgi:DNA-binding NtrC family response regulator